MRITGGLARGILLKSVDEAILRPATDYLRQAVFSVLGERIMGCHFLDLFAGTGSYGLESLSRGAHSGIFVENNHRIAGILGSNLKTVCKSMGHGNESRIWNVDALKIKTEERFDLIFVDSPYDLMREKSDELLALGVRLLKRSENSRLVIEMPGDFTLNGEQNFGLWELRRLAKRGKNSPAAVIYSLA
ncbi:MAG: RsmD family RNA methyltransferase [Puniceicoccales bacterium]|jgi:16S rRNA (guanine(966)-N(2))-methyltransferase RsmD|nr:RsmD family RNA methyltransferase [Puniceicoccales bacterium]